jgi:protein translocase SecG subunit
MSLMNSIVAYLPYFQIGLGVLLIVGILIQTSAAGLGAAFGGDSVDSGFHARRGPEQTIFVGTIIIAVLFVVVSFLTFLYV